MPLTYQQALAYIHHFDDPYLAALRDHGKQTWGVATMEALLGRLGNPHLAYPTIHVAGTKGKGSTAAFIMQSLVESGLRVGLYASPHLQDWRERIQIDGKWISEESLSNLVEAFRVYAEQTSSLSAFEAATALAFWHFARERCDAAVIEVGLGGRLDATSVIEPLVAVITSLSLDHTQLLGDTLAQIAAEKAAIIKPGTPVISAPQRPDALQVIEACAEAMGSSLTLVGRDWLSQPVALTLEGSRALIGKPDHLEAYRIGLPGAFQIENAAVALAALHEVDQAGLMVAAEGIRAGLMGAQWPGRFEKMSDAPLIIIDCAHNPYSITKLIETLSELAGERLLTFVFGCMADKDIEGMLSNIIPVAHRVILTQAAPDRAASAQDLFSIAERIARSLPKSENGTSRRRPIDLLFFSTMAESVAYAMEQASPDDAICIAGSLSIAGEARGILMGKHDGINGLFSKSKLKDV
ncbi:MAG: bifunctional folylpolyglutamate synthase/dihydrofolate synthase [Anaerolineae bacterium]|nr:bifunctional folylpolyglutamate synthase/dihydrofolate synthase [Anaerolineae bacterium]